MTIPIIKTKLHIHPLRDRVVYRPELTARISNGMNENKLIIISAPAGFGKTTLASEWITGCALPVAWLSLDDNDNDTTQFLAYLLASLKTIHEDITKRAQEALSSLESVDIESIMTIIINDITDISYNFALVLDDYHVINNKSVNNAVDLLIDHMPINLKLIITTRVDPLLNLVRLRARNQLIEIRAKDLRFTYSQAAKFFKHIMDVNISDKDLLTLETCTEGWVAGLQLAAISMQGQGDITSFVEKFSGNHYFIMDYLIEEVLKQQSEEIQSFLLHTSILDRLCGPLCDAIMIQSSHYGQKILEYLHSSNLFIVTLDNERQWYRYHHLFADLLKQRLTNEEFDINQLHIRASEWLQRNGFIAEAINHSVIAKDFKKAMDMIEIAWKDMDKNMQSATWLSWVRKIPEELISLRPVLSVGYAWALLDAGEYDSCEQKLIDAEKGIIILNNKKTDDEQLLDDIVVVDEYQYNFLPATIESARAYHASVLGDIKATITHAKKAQLLSKKEDYHGRNIVETILGLAFWADGELEAAFSTITVGVANNQFAIMVAVVLAEIRIEQGKLKQAVSIYEKALQAVILEESINFQSPIASFYLGLGRLRLLKGDLKGATVMLRRSKVQGEKIALPTWRYSWHILKARIKESQGEFKKALELFNKAEKHYFENPIPNIEPIDALRTRVLLRQGTSINTIDWMKNHGLSIDGEIKYTHEFEYIVFVRMLILDFKHTHNNKTFQDTIQLTKRLLKATQNGDRIGRVIEIFILQTLIYDANNDKDMALKCLKEAVILAEPEEYFQIFIDEGQQLYHLLNETYTDEMIPDYVSTLLTVLKEKKDTIRSKEVSSRFTQGLIEPLSVRELEVLKLITQGFSNREICDKLFLALSTVKGYNQNLYGKLQVKSRTEAIVRARELELL